MTNRVAEFSQVKVARFAGLAYLTILIAGIFAEFFVRQSLIAPGDAAATAGSILASEGLFRLGITADLVMILSDITLAVLFYELFRPVNRTLSLLAAFFRLAQAATLGINLLNLFLGLQLMSGAGYLAVIDAGMREALGLLFLQAHAMGYSLAMVFFALSLVVLTYLVFKSGYFPRILGVLLAFAAAGYLVDSFAQVLLSNYSSYADLFALIVFAPAFIAELSMTVWLLFKGVKAPRRQVLAEAEAA